MCAHDDGVEARQSRISSRTSVIHEVRVQSVIPEDAEVAIVLLAEDQVLFRQIR